MDGDTRLLAYDEAATVSEIARWANALIGNDVPDSPGYQVVRVVQFQLLKQPQGYAALMLVEVTQGPPDPPIALKEADIAVIEQITSVIDKMPEQETTDSEP
jgi:hypothetical protein